VPDETVIPDHVRGLADGARMPVLGLGVWQVPGGPECENAVRWALEAGYRHIDTAQAYGNIIHWPQKGPTWGWPGMERARELGYARSIGVSNYSVSQLDDVMAIATIPPVVNQVQFSPFEYGRRLLDTCTQRDIALEAYSPLGTGRHLSDPTVVRIAERVGRRPAQVLLRWCVQRGTIVIPKSTHRERIAENAHIFDFMLADADMAALDALDQTRGTDQARERKWW
jgi:diketogulonate reductase-like aldo/keto reductase